MGEIKIIFLYVRSSSIMIPSEGVSSTWRSVNSLELSKGFNCIVKFSCNSSRMLSLITITFIQDTLFRRLKGKFLLKKMTSKKSNNKKKHNKY